MSDAELKRWTAAELLDAALIERLWSHLPLTTYCTCEPEWDEDYEVCEVNPDTCECDRRTIPCVRNSMAAVLGEPQIRYADPPHRPGHESEGR